MEFENNSQNVELVQPAAEIASTGSQTLCESDKSALSYIQSKGKVSGILGCIFILIVTTLVGWIFSILIAVKCNSIKDEKVRSELNLLAILTPILYTFTLIGGIVCAFLYAAKAKEILNRN